MAIKIGHASSDERGKSNGGISGDQTKGEVCIRSWYSSPWDIVLRCTDSTKAELMAKACEKGCANNKIGYDQVQRNTLNTYAKKVNYDLSKIKTACECDCSSFMTVCAQAAGITIPYTSGNAPYTGNMKAKFTSTGYFKVLTDKKYLTMDKYLKRGDILIRSSGHTAMVLENGSAVPKTSITNSTKKASDTKMTQIKEGSSGKAVKIWQAIVGVKIDGEFGPNTEKATIAFQKKAFPKNKNEWDGIVGEKTWKAGLESV